MDNTAHTATKSQILAFIERIERLDAEIKDGQDARKDVLAEAKSRGYDSKVLAMIVRIRKRDADDVAEENAIMQMYLDAIGDT